MAFSSFHPSSSTYPGVGSRGQQAKQGSPDFSLSGAQLLFLIVLRFSMESLISVTFTLSLPDASRIGLAVAVSKQYVCYLIAY